MNDKRFFLTPDQLRGYLDYDYNNEEEQLPHVEYEELGGYVDLYGYQYGVTATWEDKDDLTLTHKKFFSLPAIFGTDLPWEYVKIGEGDFLKTICDYINDYFSKCDTYKVYTDLPF